MTSLLLAVLAAGAANVAFVVFLADRLGPQAGTASAGELAATTGSLSGAGRNTVRVGNENATTLAARRAA